MGAAINVTRGATYNDLTVEDPTPKGVRSHRKVLCRCVCGNPFWAEPRRLLNNYTKDCGCKKGARIAAAKTTHGHGGSRRTKTRPSKTYNAWCSMWERCNNPNNSQSKNYSERGISVCSRWEKFEDFLSDMGESPPGMILDREDVNGNYEPTNCRWVTPLVSARNKRNTQYATLNGVRKTVAEWCVLLGMNHSQVCDRVKKQGITREEALSQGNNLREYLGRHRENEACASLCDEAGQSELAERIRSRLLRPTINEQEAQP